MPSSAPTLLTNPHTLATAGLVHYSGDRSPFDHGGYWYDSSTWESDGYASAVEVCCLDDGPSDGRHVVISLLVINKPRDMAPAFGCCGVPLELQSGIHAQIEACKVYGHTDPDESDWREPSTYAFVLPDDIDGGSFQDYCRIHGATVSDKEQVWGLLNRLVGRELFQG